MMNNERVEKIRQAIMRYRELLDLLKVSMAHAESDYQRLFATLSDEERALPEKERQRAAAIVALDDLEALRRAVLTMQFETHNMAREFEQLYGHIAPQPEAE